ncbi:hypothetical protein HDU83_004054, partial [Entophlyctis luteolus]
MATDSDSNSEGGLPDTSTPPMARAQLHFDYSTLMPVRSSAFPATAAHRLPGGRKRRTSSATSASGPTAVAPAALHDPDYYLNLDFRDSSLFSIASASGNDDDLGSMSSLFSHSPRGESRDRVRRYDEMIDNDNDNDDVEMIPAFTFPQSRDFPMMQQRPSGSLQESIKIVSETSHPDMRSSFLVDFQTLLEQQQEAIHSYERANNNQNNCNSRHEVSFQGMAEVGFDIAPQPVVSNPFVSGASSSSVAVDSVLDGLLLASVGSKPVSQPSWMSDEISADTSFNSILQQLTTAFDAAQFLQLYHPNAQDNDWVDSATSAGAPTGDALLSIPPTSKITNKLESQVEKTLNCSSDDVSATPRQPHSVLVDVFDNNDKLQPASAHNGSSCLISESLGGRSLQRIPALCCSCCTALGVLEVRITSANAPHSAYLKCTSCSSTTNLSETNYSRLESSVAKSEAKKAPAKPKKSKENGHSANDAPTDGSLKLICLACKNLSAVGKIEDSMKRVAIGLNISILCASCDEKFLFCAECGGGGKTRTGKYRPRGLFPPGRKTCFLPHIRIGTAVVEHQVLNFAHGTSGKSVLVAGVRDVFFDAFVGLHAVPSTYSTFQDLSEIFEYASRIWRSSAGEFLNPHENSRKHVLVTIASIEKEYRMKSKSGASKKSAAGHVGSETRNILWANALQGSAGPANEPLDMLGSTSTCSNSVGKVSNVEQTFVSFAVSHWDQANCALFIVLMTLRSIHQPSS